MSTLSRMAFAIAACCCTPIAYAADLQTVVDQAIKPIMREYDVPGIAVAVTVNGKPSYFSYGVASKESGTLVSENTLFELGSISKTFTATLAAYAVAEGKLSLDDHPSRYMPQLKGRPVDKATVLHLGTYTAGGFPLQFPDAVKNDEAGMLAYFRNWKPRAAPGKLREYSNPSLGLFGHLAALALKEDFAEAMQKHVISPLGLNNTYVRVPESAMPNYAWGYDKDKPVRTQPDLFYEQTYGVRSTSTDMIRYVQANIDPDAPMRPVIASTHIGYFRTGLMTQGLGWEQFAYPTSLEHLLEGNSSDMFFKGNATKRIAPQVESGLYDKTGSTRGFGAYVLFVPEKKIGVVILANRNYPIPARVKAAHAILTQLEN
ncbi:beta-lactamase class C [Duganella sp. SG902]|nr:class C beta-lactamase [Duganella sp. SG902]NVM76944.1 beta-lactamase class C [Duganella sp. SG902]